MAGPQVVKWLIVIKLENLIGIMIEKDARYQRQDRAMNRGEISLDPIVLGLTVQDLTVLDPTVLDPTNPTEAGPDHNIHLALEQSHQDALAEATLPGKSPHGALFTCKENVSMARHVGILILVFAVHGRKASAPTATTVIFYIRSLQSNTSKRT